jgi:hypothetical protein
MQEHTIYNAIMTFLNSAVGLTVLWAAMVGLFWYLASRFNPLQDKWKQYEGSIITAIRLAEKQIPDDTPNAGLARLDLALRLVLDAYAQANSGRPPSADMIEQIRQGIQITHNDLDRFGGLSSKTEAA